MKIAVVGLGFAGSALGLLLARQGHQVELWETTPNPGPVGAGILLQPSGQAVLERLSLLDPILSEAQRIHSLRARNRWGKRFMDLDLGSLSTFGIRRGQIFQALLGALQQSSVQIHCGAKVDDVEPEGYLWSQQERQGPFDLVVLADGSRSRLRHRVARPLWQEEYSIGALWFCHRSPFPGDHLFQVADGSRRLCGLLPTGQGGCSLFWSCTPQEFQSYQQDHFQKWRTLVCELAPEAQPVVEGLDPQKVLFAPYRHAWMPEWHRQRLVLIGDCAHPMSPHLGQGINLALLDAFSLSRSLEMEKTPEGAIQRYLRRRKNQTRLYSGLSFLLTPFFQSRLDLIQSWGRDLVLPWMLRWPWMAEQMRQAVYGQKGSWWSGWRALEELT